MQKNRIYGVNEESYAKSHILKHFTEIQKKPAPSIKVDAEDLDMREAEDYKQKRQKRCMLIMAIYSERKGSSSYKAGK